MSHDDCIFCKIIAGDIPSAKVYEDEHVYAFLDISQVTKGHTLVIPKQHTRNLYDTTEDIAANLFKVVPKIANAIKDTYGAVGMNLLNNNEAEANQQVFHLHLHLLPKYQDEAGFSANWPINADKYTAKDLETIANEISEKVQA